mgnify:CR=1 FL=1
MAAVTFAVMGATGHVGRVAAEELLRRGHRVRALGRDPKKLEALKAKGASVQPVAFDDAKALAAAFKGANGVFAMIPPSYTEDDFGAYQDRVGQAIVEALRAAGVAQLVSLSSLGAQQSEGTGPIKGLHRQEERLKGVTDVRVIHLRPGYFMENQLWSIPVIQSQGLNGSPIKGDVPIQMVATQDIGETVASLLETPAASNQQVVELVGTRPVTLTEATAVLGRAIGKPDLQYVQFPYDQARQAMLGMGMKPSIADLMIEMYQGFNEAKGEPTQDPRRGRVTLEQFADTFAKAYRQSAPAAASASRGG